jgi:hypothetical protein
MLKSEGGPVVVPKERDYAAARMGKGRRWEGEKVRRSEKSESKWVSLNIPIAPK